MSGSDLWNALASRLAPAIEGSAGLSGRGLIVALAIAAAGVFIPPFWRILRLGVTLVHELGHALVGLLCGRRFTGFVLRGDMSGHAVTVGRARGPGRALTTWAGYPMPGIIAVALAGVVAKGYAGAALGVLLTILVLALPRVRSGLTLGVLLAVGGGLGALWWWRDDTRQSVVLLALTLVLLVGAWRHLSAVVGSPRGSGSDPDVLRQLTGIPAVIWNVTFALVLAACTWGVWRVLA